MLIEKEVIAPGTYWYTDEATGLPRKLTVTPELTKYWHEQGNKMLSAGLPVPVPYEHDFSAHPMTPKDKLLNNAGEVKEYRMKGETLWSVVDIQDPDVKKKIGHSIRWTSPWINSFTDGAGVKWDNVISHLALTTRPRVTKQTPFGTVAAALSMATNTKVDEAISGDAGLCLSRAGRIFTGKNTGHLRPRYPMAFSMWAGGVPLSEGDLPFKKKPKPGTKGDEGKEPKDDFSEDLPDEEKAEAAQGEEGEEGEDGMANPLADAKGDMAMEEILCDLLQALGVPMPDESNEAEFKRHLYEAAMSKIKELTSQGMGKDKFKPDQNKPPNQQPNASQPQNPLISGVQQEQQPMYMSVTMNLEDINKLTDPALKAFALSVYNDKLAADAKSAAAEKLTKSLLDAKLKEEASKREQRVLMLGKRSPTVKADLEAMQANPSFALSMGEGGAIIDPMAQTLAVLEKGLADMPRLLTMPAALLSVNEQPSDADMLSPEAEAVLVEDMARMMGASEEKRSA